MKLVNKRATLMLCSVAVAAMTSTAYAKPVKKAAHRQGTHRVATVQAPTAPLAVVDGFDNDPRYPGVTRAQAAQASTPATRRSRGRARGVETAQASAAAIGGFSSSSLVSEARKYIGTNPTGRGSLWCGAFMDLVLKRTGHAGGGNLASAYARYGTRVSGPQVGAIAVMGRKGGGHVGVVSGVDANGNPIIISGNHNRTTAESVYPASRIVAYVMPN